MTDRDYVLQQLSNHPRGLDGLQIISSSIRDRGVGLDPRSRVADVRRDGWVITCRVEGKTRAGRPRYVYRLQGRAVPSAKGGSSVGREQRGVSEPPAAAPLDAPPMMPDKGERIRVTGWNEAGQVLPEREGVVLGVEYRVSPPVIRLRTDDGKCHEVTNIGYGSYWSALDAPPIPGQLSLVG